MSALVAQAAAHSWLTDGTYGLNARLALYRTAESLTTTDLPDVAQFDTYLHLSRTASGWPYLSITAPSTGPETRRNSRTNDHEIEITLVTIAKYAGQHVRGPVLAVQRYMKVLTDMVYAISEDREGATLLNASGVEQCVMETIRYGVDEDANGGKDNYAATLSLAVRTQHGFPLESY